MKIEPKSNVPVDIEQITIRTNLSAPEILRLPVDHPAAYLEIDEELNAVDYLLRARREIAAVTEDKLAWKWAIIALHGALYGFAVCALRQTDPDRVVYRIGKDKDIERLIGAEEAFKRCQSPEWLSPSLLLSEHEAHAIDTLRENYRNNFEHFIPLTWLIREQILAEMCLAVLRPLRFLALEASIYVSIDEDRRSKIEQAINGCSNSLQAISKARVAASPSVR